MARDDLKGPFPPRGFRGSSQSQGITDLQLQLQVVGGASSAIAQLRHPDPEQGQAVTLQEGLEAGLGVRVLERHMWEQSETSRQNHGKLLQWDHGETHGRARTRHLSRSNLIQVAGPGAGIQQQDQYNHYSSYWGVKFKDNGSWSCSAELGMLEQAGPASHTPPLPLRMPREQDVDPARSQGCSSPG